MATKSFSPVLNDGRAKAVAARSEWSSQSAVNEPRLYEGGTRLLNERSRVHQTPTAEDVHKTIIREALIAGCSVGLVPYSANPRVGFRLSALLVNDSLCAIQRITNAQETRRRRQTYAHTGVRADALEKFDTTIFFVAVPGYEQMILVVPSHDLVSMCDAKRVADRISLYIPLAYRPDNPIVDFWAYRDRFDLIPRRPSEPVRRAS
jgi:hypothetical protein